MQDGMLNKLRRPMLTAISGKAMADPAFAFRLHWPYTSDAMVAHTARQLKAWFALINRHQRLRALAARAWSTYACQQLQAAPAAKRWKNV